MYPSGTYKHMFVCECVHICICMQYYRSYKENNKGLFFRPWGKEFKDDKNKIVWCEYKGSKKHEAALFQCIDPYPFMEENFWLFLWYFQISINFLHNCFVQLIFLSYWLSLFLLWIYTVLTIMHH